ncbi:UNKNOWN [Stylonychia lemnae]|uniref:Uncharacterized protein n=1 Tax=Stylonychia lemnae TaxID=5949 RepID=A0A078BAG1_STYLE|nr:UNKNOWN [Stylonychia lemnae]|eukprot:CDW91545.1 UNKNOWN [Stylonychia lemnae]
MVFQKYLLSTLDRYCNPINSRNKNVTENDIFDFIFGDEESALPQQQHIPNITSEGGSFFTNYQTIGQNQSPQKQRQQVYKTLRVVKGPSKFNSSDLTAAKKLRITQKTPAHSKQQQQAQSTPLSMNKQLKDQCFQIFRQLEFHHLLTNTNNLQLNEVRAMKFFCNTLIILKVDEPMKLIKTKKDLVELIEREKMKLIHQLNQVLISQEIVLDTGRQIQLRMILKKIQKHRIFFNSQSNFYNLLQLLINLIEYQLKQKHQNQASASPSRLDHVSRQDQLSRLDQQTSDSSMFDFRRELQKQQQNKSRIKSQIYCQSSLERRTEQSIQPHDSRNLNFSNIPDIPSQKVGFFTNNNEYGQFNWKNPFDQPESIIKKGSENQSAFQSRNNNVFVSEIPSLDQTFEARSSNNLDDDKNQPIKELDVEISDSFEIQQNPNPFKLSDIVTKKKNNKFGKFNFGQPLNIKSLEPEQAYNDVEMNEVS